MEPGKVGGAEGIGDQGLVQPRADRANCSWLELARCTHAHTYFGALITVGTVYVQHYNLQCERYQHIIGTLLQKHQELLAQIPRWSSAPRRRGLVTEYSIVPYWKILTSTGYLSYLELVSH